MTYFIHPTVVIDDGAEIGSGTKIWHFSHVMSSAKIGDNCVLGQNVFVGSNVMIGNGVKIQNNVSLFERVKIKDDAFIGPSVVFTNVSNPRSFVERKEEFKDTIVDIGASLGANTTVVCGNKIGAYALVGAGSVVTKNVLPYALVVGNPAKQIGWVSKRGLKLTFNRENIAICVETGQKYQLIEGTVVAL